MILLDKPYISDFLVETIKNNNWPIIESPQLNNIINTNRLKIISTEEAVSQIQKDPTLLLYSNSENAIGWIEKNLPNNRITEKIRIFKDKIAFRELIQPDYPEYFFKAVDVEEIEALDPDKLPFPFVIKPSVGFFSLAVHKIANSNEWMDATNKLLKELAETKLIFPVEVVNTTKFIIEAYIPGEEFAFDCYFDCHGKPVILNILKHLFGSEKDVSDRVYITSKQLIEQHLEAFTSYMQHIGNLANIKNFPCHVEVRIDEDNAINPIEINPLRFGGLCTTADLAMHAYGINPYEYYFQQKIPNWQNLLKGKENNTFALVIFDNSTGFMPEEIESFNYEGVIKRFSNPLELRKFDYHEYPLFGYLFCETKDPELKELDAILRSDLREFVQLKD
jgi:hypothetical protein